MNVLQKIPAGSACVVVSLPLAGKKELLYGYLAEGLKEKEPVVFITTDKPPSDIKKELLVRKIFYGKALRFIDCYSKQTDETSKDTEDIMRVSGPLALNEISIALSEIESDIVKQSKTHRIIFDSLSTTLMYTNPQTVGRFVQVLVAKIKKAGGSVLFALEEGMHDDKAIVTIEHLMDCIINVKREKGKTLVNARGLEGFEGWKELKKEK